MEINTNGCEASHPVSPRCADLIDKAIGARLRLQRSLANISQSQLAKSLGITFQQIQKYENGDNRIGAGRLQHIATALQIPVASFFDEGIVAGGNLEAVREITCFLVSREGLDLVRAFLKIENPAMRRALLELARVTSRSTEP